MLIAGRARAGSAFPLNQNAMSRVFVMVAPAAVQVVQQLTRLVAILRVLPVAIVVLALWRAAVRAAKYCP